MKLKDCVGLKFGKLEVIDYIVENNRYYFISNCDCGNKNVKQLASKIKRGDTLSCGCVRKSNEFKKGYVPHNYSEIIFDGIDIKHHRLYKIYTGIIYRCHNINSKDFVSYGGRDIIVCDEWRNSYEDFYKWSMENGYNESLSIDRVDNEKGYNPYNCRWATQKEQMNNTRRNKKYIIDEKEYTLSQIEDAFGISQLYLSRLIRQGYSIYEAMLMARCIMKSELCDILKISEKDFNLKLKNGDIIPDFITKSNKRMFMKEKFLKPSDNY